MSPRAWLFRARGSRDRNALMPAIVDSTRTRVRLYGGDSCPEAADKSTATWNGSTGNNIGEKRLAIFSSARSEEALFQSAFSQSRTRRERENGYGNTDMERSRPAGRYLRVPTFGGGGGCSSLFPRPLMGLTSPRPCSVRARHPCARRLRTRRFENYTVKSEMLIFTLFTRPRKSALNFQLKWRSSCITCSLNAGRLTHLQVLIDWHYTSHLCVFL